VTNLFYYLFIYLFIYFASPGSYVYKKHWRQYKTRQGHHNSKSQLLWAQMWERGTQSCKISKQGVSFQILEALVGKRCDYLSCKQFRSYLLNWSVLGVTKLQVLSILSETNSVYLFFHSQWVDIVMSMVWQHMTGAKL